MPYYRGILAVPAARCHPGRIRVGLLYPADEVINKARQRSQAGDACLISGSMAIGTWSAVLASRLRAAACRQHRSLHCRAD
jgi:hypothetical protein